MIFIAQVSFNTALVNLFLTSVSVLYLLKTPENLWFSGAFRGYEKGILARNELTINLIKSICQKKTT